MNYGRDFGHWTLNSIETVRDCGSLEVGLNVFLRYEMATNLWEPGHGIWWFE